jgi:hypothetical protein
MRGYTGEHNTLSNEKKRCKKKKNLKIGLGFCKKMLNFAPDL